ncbi:hypothetical protein O181_013372 [Austropuccinia psidii MF-1]|uniref:Uncharacterized protein n=1 Tax=Austropuccinia psidii MF-1 TaxID=1389203 RepID=A0A9Q3BZH9_9BASI|nr:hypothetical protein [Austropuccinia psidii MF-1]
MRNHKLLTPFPEELEHEVKCRCNQSSTLDDIENTLKAEKKKFYAIEKVPEEESPTEDCESESMGDAIREQSDEDQDPREEFLVEYQKETPLEIQDIQLEAGMEVAYIHGTSTKINFRTENAQHPLIIDSAAYFPIVARNNLDHHFPNWEKQLLPTKEKNFKSASGKMRFVGTIIKEMIIPHWKGNIRLNSEFVVLEDAQIQGLLMGTDYQRMYGIDI